jgi:hypothetical protein
MNTSFVTIVVFVPESHADRVRAVLSAHGCGHIGDYDSCSFSVKGTGRFRPLQGAKPFVGALGTIEEVAEERIETICPKDRIAEVFDAVKKIHPYEEPAMQAYNIVLPSAPQRGE